MVDRMTSRNVARLIALSSTLAAFGWAFAGACGGHPLGVPHPTGGGGKGSAGSSASGTAGATGTGTGAAGTAATGAGGSTTTGAAGSTTTGAAGAAASGGGGSVSAACANAQNDYENFRDKLVQSAGSFPCKVDTDCTPLGEPGACGPLCPDVAVLSAAEGMIVSGLKGNAARCDAVCPMRPPVLCPARPAICQNGQCALAGVTGAAGSTGSTGAGGTTGSAGASGGAGQGGTCGPCNVAPCSPGYMSVVDPTISCCPICRPVNCAMVVCANPNCPGGTHAEVPTGKCCPVCLPGVSQACNTAETQYSNSRTALLDKYGSTPCQTDADCRLVFENNSCVHNCGEALPVVNASNFETNLASLAMACNASCPPTAVPPCAVQVAVCSNGRCSAIPGAGGAPPPPPPAPNPQACQNALAAYDADRAALFGKLSSVGCQVDTDCALVFEHNSCVSNCGSPLPAIVANAFQMGLATDSAACNASCPLIAPPICTTVSPVCVAGTCAARD
jgi:hypothetical protein